MRSFGIFNAIKRIATSIVLVAFLLPTCENVIALSVDHFFGDPLLRVHSFDNSGSDKNSLDKKDGRGQEEFSCNNDHDPHSPCKNCCSSEFLNSEILVGGGNKFPSRAISASDFLAFSEIQSSTYTPLYNETPIPTSDRHSYANLVGIIKRLD